MIVATPYLRAVFGREFVEVDYIGSQKERYTSVDFEERYLRGMKSRVVQAQRDYGIMSIVIKDRFKAMRKHVGFQVFSMHGTDKHRLTLLIGDGDTKDTLAQLHVNDSDCEVFITMVGPHIDLHTNMRVAFNKSGKDK